MSRHVLVIWAWVGLAAATGCHPIQPSYFMDNGDLSHYKDVATQIEYPDVDVDPLDEVAYSQEPLTLENADKFETWDLALEEVIRTTLSNAQVIRTLGGGLLGGRFSETGFVQQSQAGQSPTTLLGAPQQVGTTFDPAISMASPTTGVEAALAAFDTQWTTSMFWEKNDRPQNFRSAGGVGQIFTPFLEQDTGRFSSELSKVTRGGTIFTARNNVFYDANNSPARALFSDWNVNYELEFRQPLLQGAGAFFNGIAGPISPFSGQGTQAFDGVVLARINNDIALDRFEQNVRNTVSDAENSYWELYFAYRNLQAQKAGRDSAQATWKRVHSLFIEGAQGGERDKEAAARTQFYTFDVQVKAALNDLFRAERRLRYMMGLAPSDGRLIRPKDEPTTAHVRFDWISVKGEGLVRSPEIRMQKRVVQQTELQVLAARNYLLPRFDAVGRWRFMGLGDNLIDPTRNGLEPTQPGSDAYNILTRGSYQEWNIGLQLSMPIGFRKEL